MDLIKQNNIDDDINDTDILSIDNITTLKMIKESEILF